MLVHPLCHILLCKMVWWRHRMETFSSLLVFCADNSPVTGEFPAQRPVTRNFEVFFDSCLNRQLSKQSGDFRRGRAHYAVTVMGHAVWWPVPRLLSVYVNNAILQLIPRSDIRRWNLTVTYLQMIYWPDTCLYLTIMPSKMTGLIKKQHCMDMELARNLSKNWPKIPWIPLRHGNWKGTYKNKRWR